MDLLLLQVIPVPFHPLPALRQRSHLGWRKGFIQESIVHEWAFRPTTPSLQDFADTSGTNTGSIEQRHQIESISCHSSHSPTNVVIIAARLLASQAKDLFGTSPEDHQATVIHAGARLVKVVYQYYVLPVENVFGNRNRSEERIYFGLHCNALDRRPWLDGPNMLREVLQPCCLGNAFGKIPWEIVLFGRVRRRHCDNAVR